MAVEADSASFGKDDTVTAYLVSFLDLLNRVQSYDDDKKKKWNRLKRRH